MKTQKKRTWKFWIGRTLLVLLLIGGLWLTNLIWFKPFNIKHFYDKLFVQLALDSPETTTQLGIPVIYDWYKDDLDDISPAKQVESYSKLKADYETLMSYNFEKQSPENQLNTKILGFFLKSAIDGEPYQDYGYAVNQMFGVQSSLPSLMESAHKLEDKSDMEAYISRLSKFDTKFNQLIENLKISESKGIIPPKFVIKIVLDEMKGFVEGNSDKKTSAVQSNILYTNFETKVDQLAEISEEQKADFKKQVEKEIENTVFPAYKKLIGYFENLNKKATNDAGVWKFPNGDGYYRYQLKQSTTLELDPEDVHQIGLSEVARIKSEMNAILSSEGYADSTKTLGEIIQKLNTEDRFLYPNTEEGRQLILDDYTGIIDEISANLDNAFNIRPKAGIEVKRIPEFKEDGLVAAYYQRPAMDGSRGGVFFANLRNTNETVKFSMKTLAYHEGVPGHHFQIAIASELQGLPMFRGVIPFTSYIEGWALYTEQLAWELGFYDNDPFGNLGRLQAEMFRATRLVVDTGIHHKKWTREEAIAYMIANTGMTTGEVTSEIERYIVMPGQACAYKIGMIKILELREMAKTALGDRFDLRDFHDVVLKNGAVPLVVLEEIVQNYIDDIKKG
ncbi:MAG: DUF885 domain-containing protein [Cellulophaga sp.]|nr:DUF885 domain-containing protein [Cellulophaga sp.]